MAAVTLVENQIDAGRALLGRLKNLNFPIAAACWAKSTEEDRWTLYIASPRVDEKGRSEAYREVIDARRSVGSGWLTSSDVELVGTKAPAAHDAVERLRPFSGWVPPQFPGIRIGGIIAEDVYVYPLGEVEVTIYGLSFRGEPSGLLHLSFEPHNPNSTFEIVDTNGRKAVYPAQTGIDWVVAAPEGAALERDDIGRTVLGWNLRGTRTQSTANTVLIFAEHGLHGFRIIREPSTPANGKVPSG
jgi:hypothetical protein